MLNLPFLFLCNEFNAVKSLLRLQLNVKYRKFGKKKRLAHKRVHTHHRSKKGEIVMSVSKSVCFHLYPPFKFKIGAKLYFFYKTLSRAKSNFILVLFSLLSHLYSLR